MSTNNIYKKKYCTLVCKITSEEIVLHQIHDQSAYPRYKLCETSHNDIHLNNLSVSYACDAKQSFLFQ